MGLWDHLAAEDLIKAATVGNFGLAPKKWTEQLEELRGLPETPPAIDENRDGGS